MIKSNCYWITGLSGSGKTTLATTLSAHLRSMGRPTVLLDGDELRSIMAGKGYSREERLQIALRYSSLCKLLVGQGIYVVIAVIGLFDEVHRWNRINITNYVEIYLDTPISELIRRDPKGIYAGAKSGSIRNVAGIDLKVDYPRSPHIHIKWSEEKDIDSTSDELFKKLGL